MVTLSLTMCIHFGLAGTHFLVRLNTFMLLFCRFAALGAGLAWGGVQESAKRLVFGNPKSHDKQSALSPFLSEKNAERLALALCRMRGAALKIGQMLSIQDESLVPAPVLNSVFYLLLLCLYFLLASFSARRIIVLFF